MFLKEKAGKGIAKLTSRKRAMIFLNIQKKTNKSLLYV